MENPLKILWENFKSAMKHLAPGNRYSAPKDEEQKASAGIVRLSQSTKQGKDAILPGLAGKEEKQGKNSC